MGIFSWLRRRRSTASTPTTSTTSDSARELDQRQHEVARRLHILEYETSEAIRAMRERKRRREGGQ
jgi:hypothetical protein